MKSYIIELRFDDNDEDDRHAGIVKVCQVAARHVLSVAMVLSVGSKKPKIAVHSSDHFTGTAEIEIMEDELAA